MVELELKVEDNNVIGDNKVYENDTVNHPPPKKQRMNLYSWLKPVGEGKLVGSVDKSDKDQTYGNDKLIDSNEKH